MSRRSVGRYLTAAIILGAFTILAVGEYKVLQSPLFDQANSSPSEKQFSDKYAACRPIPVFALTWVPIRTRLCVGFFRNIRFFDAYHDSINAFSALLVAFFTFTLWRTTQKLFIAGEKQVEIANRSLTDIQRAFVSIDGFNVELSVLSDQPEPDLSVLELTLNKDPDLHITRLAVPPRWKNSGNTPTKNMRFRINFAGPALKDPLIFWAPVLREGLMV